MIGILLKDWFSVPAGTEVELFSSLDTPYKDLPYGGLNWESPIGPSTIQLEDGDFELLQSIIEDPRKNGLKNGLRQLDIDQLQRVIDYDGEMIFDEFNYHDGKFCALAIGVGLDKTIINPTHEVIYEKLIDMGYKVYNTRGIKGNFYINNRKEDLLEAAKEVLIEKLKLYF